MVQIDILSEKKNGKFILKKRMFFQIGKVSTPRPAYVRTICYKSYFWYRIIAPNSYVWYQKIVCHWKLTFLRLVEI